MHFKSHTPEAVSELLLYLAENEDFSSTKSIGSSFSKKEIKNILKEIAEQIKDSGFEEEAPRANYSDQSLSPKALSLISCLSPREEMLLFKSFKIV